MAREQLTWNDLDIDNLPPENRALYDAITEAKQAWEADTIARLRAKGLISSQQSAIFAYRRGAGYAVVSGSRPTSSKVTL